MENSGDVYYIVETKNFHVMATVPDDARTCGSYANGLHADELGRWRGARQNDEPNVAPRQSTVYALLVARLLCDT